MSTPEPPEIERPVFIAGFPRTGTTLLWHILYRHSAFSGAIPKESRDAGLVESQFYRRFFSPAVKMWASSQEATLRTWFAGDSAYFTRFLIQSFRAFHIEAAASRSATRILDKTPDNLLIADLIINAFPGARICCMNRDPADTLASFRRRREQQPGPEGAWLDIGNDVNEFVQTWNRQSAAWRRFCSENQASASTVDFRQLTINPIATLAEVLEFVGEALEAHLIEGEPPTERTSVLDGYWSHVPVANSEVWRNHVAESEAERVRQECQSFIAS